MLSGCGFLVFSLFLAGEHSEPFNVSHGKPDTVSDDLS